MHMAIFQKKYISIRKKRMKKGDQLRFLERFHRLLKVGYPTLEALEAIAWDKQLNPYAHDIIESLKIGLSVDKAFEKVGFHSTITSFLYFIIANNDLEGSIEKSIFLFKQQITHQKKLQQVIRYPVILVSIFLILMFFIKNSIFPSFIEFYSMSTENPVIVTSLITIMDLATTFVFTFIIILIISYLLWKFYLIQKLPITKQIQFYQYIPFYRKYVKARTSYFFATHFSSLLKTGMSFKEILEHISKQNKLPIIAYYAFIINDQLAKGIHISTVISHFTLLEEQLTTIFQKNVDISVLEKDLTIYAEYQLEQITLRTMQSIMLLQPIIFIILGGSIIFIYASLMWPLFELIKTI